MKGIFYINKTKKKWHGNSNKVSNLGISHHLWASFFLIKRLGDLFVKGVFYFLFSIN